MIMPRRLACLCAIYLLLLHSISQAQEAGLSGAVLRVSDGDTISVKVEGKQ
ncbi:MAG: hypothetical protein LBB60_07820 [Desulfovibrio sp.]|jgi:endonuclease YncB( thermonuclease family)|nr:hypothetical protein [Desulfovibrio sp.]